MHYITYVFKVDLTYIYESRSSSDKFRACPNFLCTWFMAAAYCVRHCVETYVVVTTA